MLDNFGFGQLSVPRFYGVLVGRKRVEPHEFLDAWFGAFVLKSIVMRTNLSHR